MWGGGGGGEGITLMLLHVYYIAETLHIEYVLVSVQFDPREVSLQAIKASVQ